MKYCVLIKNALTQFITFGIVGLTLVSVIQIVKFNLICVSSACYVDASYFLARYKNNKVK